MITRIIAALIALPLVLIPIYLGGVWFALLILAGALLAGFEFYNLLEKGEYHPLRWIGLTWIILFVLSGWIPQYVPFRAVLVAGLIITLTGTLPRVENPAGVWMSTGMVAIYIGTVASLTIAMRQLPMGIWWLTFGFVITWANDVAAYFTGVTLGRNKLWPRLSPKKTWEGTAGGWLAAALTAIAIAWLSPLEQPLYFAGLVGLTCGILGLLGDLSISMLKRQMGVKESGRFMPGHGGILDRLDSLLFVLPFVSMIALMQSV